MQSTIIIFMYFVFALFFTFSINYMESSDWLKSQVSVLTNCTVNVHLLCEWKRKIDNCLESFSFSCLVLTFPFNKYLYYVIQYWTAGGWNWKGALLSHKLYWVVKFNPNCLYNELGEVLPLKANNTCVRKFFIKLHPDP